MIKHPRKMTSDLIGSLNQFDLGYVQLSVTKHAHTKLYFQKSIVVNPC